MTLLISAFDSPSATYAPIQGLSGIGIAVAGASNPQGIPDVLTLESGVMKAFCSDSHPITSGGHRTEIYFLVDNFTSETWFAWDFKIPAAYWSDFTGIITIAQYHDSPDTGDPPSRQPNFALQFNNRNLQTVWPTSLPNDGPVSSREVSAIDLEFDRWYSMCIRIKWATDTTGFREVFCDRVPVYREWNVITSYFDTVAPYFKTGMYFTNNGNPCGDKVIYVRNLTRRSGNDGYQTAIGNVPVSMQRRVV